MSVLGLRFVRGLSLVAASGGHSSSRCAGLSLSRPVVLGHRLQTRRLSSCGSRAQLLCGMWDPPRSGLEPVSPALAGRFSTTAPPGKPPKRCFLSKSSEVIRGFVPQLSSVSVFLGSFSLLGIPYLRLFRHYNRAHFYFLTSILNFFVFLSYLLHQSSKLDQSKHLPSLLIYLDCQVFGGNTCNFVL